MRYNLYWLKASESRRFFAPHHLLPMLVTRSIGCSVGKARTSVEPSTAEAVGYKRLAFRNTALVAECWLAVRREVGSEIGLAHWMLQGHAGGQGDEHRCLQRGPYRRWTRVKVHKGITITSCDKDNRWTEIDSPISQVEGTIEENRRALAHNLVASLDPRKPSLALRSMSPDQGAATTESCWRHWLHVKDCLMHRCYAKTRRFKA